MSNYQAKDLFQLQSELVDTKVDMAVSKAIDRVIEKINGLENRMHSDMHKLRHDMNQGFSSLDKRVVTIETRLGMIGEKRKGFYDRFMDYIFKAGYGVFTIVAGYLTYLILHLHSLIK